MTKIYRATIFLLMLFSSCIIISSCTKTDNGDSSNTAAVPFPPTDLTANVISPTQVDLKWLDKSTNEIGFKIEKKTLNTNFVLLASIPSDITSYSDTSLTPNTSYIYRVFSYNSVGASPTYTNEVTVITLAVDTPTVSTKAINNVTSTTASLGGDISNDGRRSVTSRGICWNTSPKPTVALTTKTSDGSGIGSFESNISGLTPGTTYYVRAYATNSVGTGYGNELSFTTVNILTLTTTSLSNITASTASGGGNIINDGGKPVTSRGVCWSVTANPTVNLNTKTVDGSGNGIFSSTITSLTPNTKYYIRSYATNSEGTTYGNELQFTTSDITFEYNSVTSLTGRIWLDRNLGAQQVATSVTDEKAYGYLYQWGRGSDGHQLRNSIITNIISSTDNPGNSNFITPPTGIRDWRNPPNDSLWQGVKGINNPCPVGFRLPTELEWDEERKSWISNNADGAFASPLKLVMAGARNDDGSIRNVAFGYYWSSTAYSYVTSRIPPHLGFSINQAYVSANGSRPNGFSVRCIKD